MKEQMKEQKMAKNRKQDPTDSEALPTQPEATLDPRVQEEPEVPRDLHRAVHLLCRASERMAAHPRHPALSALERAVQYLLENRQHARLYAPILQVLGVALALGPHHGDAAQDVKAAAEILSAV